MDLEKDGNCSPASTDVPVMHGPLTEKETEDLQREANEDTSESEELRLFLKELREKVKEEHEQQQQQQQPSDPSSVLSQHPQLHISVLPSGGLTTEFSQAGQIASQHSLQHNYSKDTDNVIAVRPLRISTAQTSYQQHVTNMTGDYCTSLTDLNATDSSSSDGGWGWIVVFGSFCCLVLVDGVCFSFALLIGPVCSYTSLRAVRHTHYSNKPGPVEEYTQFQRMTQPTPGSCIPISEMGEDFNVQQRSLLMIPGSLLIGLYLFFGPIVSALSNQFDFRPVAMLGALISTIAFLVSSYATSIQEMIFSFGFVGGIGFALIYLPAIATVGHWFQHRRPLAVGLALCGSGMGCLLAGQIIPRLVNWLTWRGALLILAAISFQCLTVIVLFRPWDIHFKIKQNQKYQRERRTAARRAAAIRKAEAERVLQEARRRKLHMNHGKAVIIAAHAHDVVGLKKQMKNASKPHNHNNPIIMRPDLYHLTNDLKQLRSSRIAQKRMSHIPTGRVNITANTLTTTATNTTNKHTVLGGYGHGGLSVSTFGRDGNHPHRSGRNNSSRGAHTSAAMQRNSHNQMSGGIRLTNGPKRVKSNRTVGYRGSIMQRIIEEKHRQRTISVGSLDGMVITRDNELISASNVINTDKPLLSASTVQRISESVARKFESKLSNAGASATTMISGRAVRACLPQLVEDYIHTQLTVASHQQAKLSPVTSCLPINQPTNNMKSSGAVATGDVVSSPTQSFTTVTKINNIPSGTNIPVIVSNANLSGQSSPPHMRVSSSNLSAGNQNVNTKQVDNMQSDEANRNQQPIVDCEITATSCSLSSSVTNCGPETNSQSNISLNKRSVSNQLVGGQTQVDMNNQLLDPEIRADIHRLICKEFNRPQYQKDFFYTGSFRHLDLCKSSQHHCSQPHPHQQSFIRKFSSAIPVNDRQTNYLIPVAPLPIFPDPHTVFDFRNRLQKQQQLNQPQHQDNVSVQNLSHVFSTNTSQSFRSTKARTSTATTTLSDDPKNPDSDQYDDDDDDDDDDVDFVCANMDQDIDDDDGHDQDDEVGDADYDDEEEEEEETGDVCEEIIDENVSAKLNNALNCTAVEQNSINEQQREDEGQDGVNTANEDHDNCDGDDLDSGTDVKDLPVADKVGESDLKKEAKYHKYSKFCRIRCTDLNRAFCSAACDPLCTFIIDLLSPKLLLSPTFIFLLLSSMLAMSGTIVPFLMLPDLLAEMNLGLGASGFIISAIGVGNIFGRLFVTLYIEKAWSTTYRLADSIWINNASLFITSIIVLIMPISRTHYTFLVFASAAFGLFSAVFVSLKSILVVELLGLDHLTNAFGYLLPFQGVAVAVGPPVAGYLRDICIASTPPVNIFTAHTATVHSATDGSFYFAGGLVMLSFIVACPLRYLANRRKSVYNIVDLENHECTSCTNEHGLESVQTYHNYDANGPFPCMVPDTNDLTYMNANDMDFIPQAAVATNNPISDAIKVTVPVLLTTNANLITLSVLSDVNSTLATAPVPQPTITNSIANVVPAVGTADGIVAAVANCGGTSMVVTPLITNTEDSIVYDGVGSLPVICAASVNSSSLPVKDIELLELKEEPGLEPVVEEEEEYEIDDELLIKNDHNTNSIENKLDVCFLSTNHSKNANLILTNNEQTHNNQLEAGQHKVAVNCADSLSNAQTTHPGVSLGVSAAPLPVKISQTIDH